MDTPDYSSIEVRALLNVNASLTEELAHAHHDIAMIEADSRVLANRVIQMSNFIGKVQGVCMGVAMSDCHPDPDGALMALFHEAQDILYPPRPEPEQLLPEVILS